MDIIPEVSINQLFMKHSYQSSRIKGIFHENAIAQNYSFKNNFNPLPYLKMEKQYKSIIYSVLVGLDLQTRKT